MPAFAVAWTLLDVAMLIPADEPPHGASQDVSAFTDLGGNLRLLALYLSASWILAAICGGDGVPRLPAGQAPRRPGPQPCAGIPATLGSSVLFGLLHTEQGLVGVVASALTGAVFTVLRCRCRTLWAPVLAHGFDDTIGFAWFFFFGPFYGFW